MMRWKDKKEWLQGLTEDQVKESAAKYGVNELERQEPASLWSMFLGAFDDIWIKILCGALALKIILAVLGAYIPAMAGEGDVVEIISIFVAIGLATGFGTLSEYRNTTRSQALQDEYNKTFAKVMRDGRLFKIPTGEIVKGDTVLIQAGDKVPADGLLIEGSIKVSQAALNGESREETKVEADSLQEADSTDYNCPVKVFMGSVVTSGEAYMVATVIGGESELGKINASLNDKEAQERKDTSTLKLEKVAAGIGRIGVTAACVAGVLQVVLTLFRSSVPVTPAYVFLLIAEAVMLMASIVIMAVPEGLPLMNSLVQSMNTESMYKMNILVSHKAQFSDSAYMNLLFSDKTGTITEGNLSVVEFILGSGEVVQDFSGEEFLRAIVLNNLARVSEGKAVGSNNMDRALLTYAMGKQYEDKENFEKIKEIHGFDSEKKCATVHLEDGTIYWKGATEQIIHRVTHYVDKDGQEKEFTKKDCEALQQQMHMQAQRTMKLLSVAKIRGDQILLMAVLCLRDNVRSDAVETVNVLRKAGIQVVMVTGDAEETAVAIAKEAGIIEDEKTELALTHDEMEQMTDDELKEVLPKLRVVSRAKPLDKKRLVTLAQEREDVCGMTGDGVNDAPALKQADVGVAMGITGSEVSKDAAAMILTDDNFATIVKAVENGRNLYRNIKFAIQFLLSGNFGAILAVLVASIFALPVPFAPVHLLFINLLTDSLPAIALGLEPHSKAVMEEKPRPLNESILTKDFLLRIAVEGVSVCATTMTAFLIGYRDGNALLASTMAFATLCSARLFHGFNCKSNKPVVFTKKVADNKYLIGAFALGILLVTAVVMIPGLHTIFKVQTLSFTQLFTVYGLAALNIPVIQLLKAIWVKAGK